VTRRFGSVFRARQSEAAIDNEWRTECRRLRAEGWVELHARDNWERLGKFPPDDVVDALRSQGSRVLDTTHRHTQLWAMPDDVDAAVGLLKVKQAADRSVSPSGRRVGDPPAAWQSMPNIKA
jgi:hypothetical protein